MRLRRRCRPNDSAWTILATAMRCAGSPAPCVHCGKRLWRIPSSSVQVARRRWSSTSPEANARLVKALDGPRGVDASALEPGGKCFIGAGVMVGRPRLFVVVPVQLAAQRSAAAAQLAEVRTPYQEHTHASGTIGAQLQQPAMPQNGSNAPSLRQQRRFADANAFVMIEIEIELETRE